MKVRFFVIALAIVGLFAVLSVAFDQTSDSQTNDVFAASELEVGEDGESAGIVPCILCGPIPTFPPVFDCTILNNCPTPTPTPTPTVPLVFDCTILNNCPTPTPTTLDEPPTPTDTPTPTPTTLDEAPTPTDTPTPTPGGNIVGDVDCSGAVNAVDAALILQLSAGLIEDLPCAKNADVNEDGDISAIDSTLILQFSAGLLTSLPP